MALKSAEIYDFVINLPEGLETNVGEKGGQAIRRSKTKNWYCASIIENLKFSF